MKHAEILKKIQTIFKNDWSDTNINFDSNSEVVDKDPYVSLVYGPSFTNRRFLSAGEGGLNFNGTLRVFCYDKNPTKTLELMDSILYFLKDQRKEGLIFKEREGLGTPYRDNVGDLYTSFVDFEVCLIH